VIFLNKPGYFYSYLTRALSEPLFPYSRSSRRRIDAFCAGIAVHSRAIGSWLSESPQ
jgi:hypothetical protein